MPRSSAQINITVTFRNTESTDALKKYVTDKLSACTKRYVGYDSELRVILSVEKRDHVAEVHLHSKGFEASASAVTDDLYSAIDKVVDNLDTQLRKQKEKTTQHKQQVAAV